MLSSLLGTDGSPVLQYLIVFVIMVVLLSAFAILAKRFARGRTALAAGPQRGRQPRLGIVDIYELDRQRQLILLRRDNVEHLLMVGGPNDVVVERDIRRTAAGRLPEPDVSEAIGTDAAAPEGTIREEDFPEPVFPEPALPAPPDPAPARADAPDLVARRRPGIPADFTPEPLPVPPPAPATAPADEVPPPRQRPVFAGVRSRNVEPVRAPVGRKVEAPPGGRQEPRLEPEPRLEQEPRLEPEQSAKAAPDAPPVTIAMPPPTEAAASPTPLELSPADFAAPSAAPLPSPAAQAAAPVPEETIAATHPEPSPPLAAGPAVPASEADVFSGMARELELALARPVPTAAPIEAARPPAEPALAETAFARPAEPAPFLGETIELERIDPKPTELEPAARTHDERPPPAQTAPQPAPPPAPPAAEPPAAGAQPKPPGPASTFSVEEIEAEFARLLGRPLDKKG